MIESKATHEHRVVEMWDATHGRMIWMCVTCAKTVQVPLSQPLAVLEDAARLFRLSHPGPMEKGEPI